MTNIHHAVITKNAVRPRNTHAFLASHVDNTIPLAHHMSRCGGRDRGRAGGGGGSLLTMTAYVAIREHRTSLERVTSKI